MLAKHIKKGSLIRLFACIYLLTIGGMAQLVAQAFSVKTSDGDSIQIAPKGRFHYDGAVFFEDKTELSNGTALTGLRLGTEVKYKQWDFKMEVDFANSKITAKDVFLQYRISRKSKLTAGHFYEPFGLDQLEGSSSRKFISKNASSQVFAPSRKIGLLYTQYGQHYWLAGGAFADQNGIKKTEGGDAGYAFTGRVATNFQPIEATTLHFGAAVSYRKASPNGYDEKGKENPREIIYKSSLNTNVESRNALESTITNANYQAKYALEMIALHGVVYLQGEYFSTLVERRKNLPVYKASGAYAQVGLLAIGNSYTYSSSQAELVRPAPKSLEFVVRYNYTDLNDSHSSINGGRMSDFSFAASYYFNKYLTFRLNYSNIDLGKHAVIAQYENINTLQARVLFAF